MKAGDNRSVMNILYDCFPLAFSEKKADDEDGEDGELSDSIE